MEHPQDLKVAKTVMRLAKTAVETGLVNGSGGNISFKSHDGKGYWITGSGTWLDTLQPDHFEYISLAIPGVRPHATTCCPVGTSDVTSQYQRSQPPPSHASISNTIDAAIQSVLANKDTDPAKRAVIKAAIKTAVEEVLLAKQVAIQPQEQPSSNVDVGNTPSRLHTNLTGLTKADPNDQIFAPLEYYRIKPSSEWKMHHEVYLHRCDVNAIVHLHPQYAVVLEALDQTIRFFTLDDAIYVKDVGKAPYYPNGSDELAQAVQEALVDHNCAIMRNHGSTCVGENIEMAYRRAALLEQAARNTFNALLLGDTDTTFPEGVILTHA